MQSSILWAPFDSRPKEPGELNAEVSKCWFGYSNYCSHFKTDQNFGIGVGFAGLEYTVEPWKEKDGLKFAF